MPTILPLIKKIIMEYIGIFMAIIGLPPTKNGLAGI